MKKPILQHAMQARSPAAYTKTEAAPEKLRRSKAEAPKRAAHRRLRNPHGHEKTLPETQDAHAGTDGKDSQGLGTAPQCRLLVSLEKPGSKTVSLGNFRVSLLPPSV